MAGAELGGDADESRRQLLDPPTAQTTEEELAQPVAGDEAAAGEIEVEETEDPPPREVAGEGFDAVESVGSVAAADDRADRGAGDDIRVQAELVERPQDPDMGPAARGAAAERETDLRAVALGFFGTLAHRRRQPAGVAPPEPPIAAKHRCLTKPPIPRPAILGRMADRRSSKVKQGLTAVASRTPRHLLI